MNLREWVSAARPHTLPLSVSGVFMGSSIAYSKGDFKWGIFLLSLLTAISLQVLSNFANDYGDGIKGADEHRLGPRRAVQSGAISPRAMLYAVIYSSIIALASASLLIYSAFGTDLKYVILFSGIALMAIGAAVKYTVGKAAYGYRGMGDIFVFVFFGFVSVGGTFFLYTKYWSWSVLFPASALGLLSAAVLNINNMRDYNTDKAAGKRTLVVLMGKDLAMIYHYNIVLLAMICMMCFSIFSLHNWINLLYVIAFIPLILQLFRIRKTNTTDRLNSELQSLVKYTMLLVMLFGLGCLIQQTTFF